MIYPAYFSYFGRPLKIEKTLDGDRVGSILDDRTGEFVSADVDIVQKAILNMSHPEIWDVELDEFIINTERARAEYVSGDGPAFVLYQVVKGMWDAASGEGRVVTDEELELIKEIYRRTFALWEAGEAYS